MDPAIRLPTKRELVQEDFPTPEPAAKLCDHGHYLSTQGHIEASVVALTRAAALAPDNPVILASLGAVLFDAGRYVEGEAVLRKSITICSEYAPSHGNLGSVLGAQGRYPEAKQCFERAIAIEPDYSDALWNYSMNLLDSGDWQTAFTKYYDARKLRGGSRLYPTPPYPEWNGEDLNGKTILVIGEQGLGDRILFSRYLKWMKDTFPKAHIMFIPNAEDLPNIWNLMWAYRGIVEFVPNGIPWPAADYHIYMLSIPRVHGTTIDNVPDDPGLILANSLKHKNSVKVDATNPNLMKVGICWTGNPAMKRNHERSIPLELFLPLAENPNVVLYSLQFGNNDLDRLGAGQLICDLTKQIGPLGYVGTAACMLNLDLMITVCTSTAHLAGALGIPTWIPLCVNPYWLWLRGREDSVWYKSVTLMRQTKANDWGPVMAEVKDSLAECAAMHVRSKEDQNKTPAEQDRAA